MPVIPSRFRGSRLIRSPHLQTIIPALLPVPFTPRFERERIATADGDVLDLDWSRGGARRLCVVSHGLEGSSHSPYVLRLTRFLRARNIDVLAWNFRGCGGECNLLPSSYHSGLSTDLTTVIEHALRDARYERLDLVGYSVGGNITLKYLGENRDRLPATLMRAAAVSVPADLASSAERLAQPSNAIYMRHFMATLRTKVRQRARRHPGKVPTAGLDKMRTFREYDGAYIAPYFGFASAEDYWSKASSAPLLAHIRIPTLLLSSRDDSFLAAESFPFSQAERSEYIHLEAPARGGHVGFWQPNPLLKFYTERRISEFLEV